MVCILAQINAVASSGLGMINTRRRLPRPITIRMSYPVLFILVCRSMLQVITLLRDLAHHDNRCNGVVCDLASLEFWDSLAAQSQYAFQRTSRVMSDLRDRAMRGIQELLNS